MTGLSRSTDGLSARQKRILYRAWHRGTREMDLLMGRYTEAAIDTMSDAEMSEMEILIDLTDRDLLSWIVESEPVPDAYDFGVFRAMKAFHKHDKPIEF